MLRNDDSEEGTLSRTRDVPIPHIHEYVADLKLRDIVEYFEWWQVYDADQRAKELRKASGYTIEFAVYPRLDKPGWKVMKEA